MFENLKKKRMFKKFEKQLNSAAVELFPENVYSVKINNPLTIEVKAKTIWNTALIKDLEEYKSFAAEKEWFSLMNEELSVEAFRQAVIHQINKDLKPIQEVNVKGLINYIADKKLIVICSAELSVNLNDAFEFEAKPDITGWSALRDIGTIGQSRIVLDPYLPVNIVRVIPESFFNFSVSLGEKFINNNPDFHIEGNYINMKININTEEPGTTITVKDSKLVPFDIF